MQPIPDHSTQTGNGGPTNPDAEMLRLGIELAAVVEAENALPDDVDEAEAAGAEAIIQRGSAIVAAILRHKAHTLAGVQVKARALAWCATDDELGEELFMSGSGHLTTDLRLAGSIAGDLLAMAPSGPCHTPHEPALEAAPKFAVSTPPDDTQLLGSQRLPAGNKFSPLLGLKMLNARLALAKRSTASSGCTP